MVSASAPKEWPSRGYLLLLLATTCYYLLLLATVLTEGVALECEAKVDAHRDVDHYGHAKDGEVHLVQAWVGVGVGVGAGVGVWVGD